MVLEGEAPLGGNREAGASSHRPLAPLVPALWGLGWGAAFTALFRCLNLCSWNFWVENYASAAVEMQIFGDKIHGLKQTVDRMWIDLVHASCSLPISYLWDREKVRKELLNEWTLIDSHINLCKKYIFMKIEFTCFEAQYIEDNEA